MSAMSASLSWSVLPKRPGRRIPSQEWLEDEIATRVQAIVPLQPIQGAPMDAMMLLRTFAAVTTIVAAALVAANWNARGMVAGFAIFIIASLAWMADGWLEGKAS